MVGVLDSNETCWFLVSHKKGTQDDTALAHKPGECTTSYTTHHISLICKITGHVAIISSLQASFQQENQRRINHPVPTPTFPIPLHRRSPRRSETATVVNGPGLLQFKSKGATYLKSENGVMRRASCLRHFSFFSDEHGNVLGFDLLSNTPTVCGMAFDCHVRPKTPFFFVVEPFASKLCQSTESIILLWMKQKETIPSYSNQIHAWRKSIKIPHMVSFSHQNSL